MVLTKKDAILIWHAKGGMTPTKVAIVCISTYFHKIKHLFIEYVFCQAIFHPGTRCQLEMVLF